MKIDQSAMMQNLFEKPNSPEWYRRQQVNKMLTRYGDAANFIKSFTLPGLQTYASKQLLRVYLGEAPHIDTSVAGYGIDVIIALICKLLEEVNDFTSAKVKMTLARQKEVAKIIIAEYPYLKISELLLFFYRLKIGKYGKFYGSVDSMVVLASLLEFLPERKKELAYAKELFEKERQAAQRAKYSTDKPVTYQEYLQLKEQKQLLQQQNEQTKEK